jgi:hypothetical protein
MATYDQTWPADTLVIADIPGAIREKGRQLVQDGIAKPATHKSSHATNGADPITPADIGAVPASDVVTSPMANKVLKLNANSKFDVSTIPIGQGINIVNGAITTGCRLTVGASLPSAPVAGQEVWFDTGNRLIKYYDGTSWIAFGAVAL